MTLYAAEERLDPSNSATATAPLGHRSWWPWAWMAIACALFSASSLVRTWQDRRFEVVESLAVAPMFPLMEIPKSLGGWNAEEGTEASLDPQVAQIAGSTDSLIRNYVEKDTGVVVTVLVLYGKPDQVIAHTPEVCYPAVGYQVDDNLVDEVIPMGDFASQFRSTVYAKKVAVQERQEVYYAFRHNGVWSPNVAGNWRALRGSSAVFKVQVQRRAGDTERRLLFNPTKHFLTAFLPALERRIKQFEASQSAFRREPIKAQASSKTSTPEVTGKP